MQRTSLPSVLALMLIAATAPADELRPMGDLPWLELGVPDLSPEPLQIRLPEHIVTLEGLVPQQVVWQSLGEGHWRYKWEADQGLKLAKQTDFQGEVQLEPGEVAFTFSISNPSTTSWGGERYNAFDVVGGKIPALRDTAGERTYVYIKDRFVTVREALGDQFKPGEAGWMVLDSSRHEAPAFRRYTERLMARVSADGQWVLGIASDTGDGATFNLDPDTSCLHQNRQWLPLAAGETRTLRGKVYLFRGTLDDLWERYQRDKAAWAESADVADLQGRQTAKEQQAAATGRLLSVWAPATASPTLERLAGLRPKLLQHPLAAWVADVMARDTGRSADLGELTQALHAFTRRGAFWLRQDAGGLWMSNGQAGVKLLPPEQGVAVASLYHLPTRTECIFGKPASGPPFRLQRYEGNNLVEVTPPSGTPMAHVSLQANAATIALTWPGIRLTVTLPREGSLLRWNAALAATDAYTLQYPVLPGLGGPGENDVTTTWGSGRGQLQRAVTGRLWNSDCRYPDSNWTTQLLSMSFGPSVLYLACHDGEFNTKSFLLEPGAEFHFTHFLPQPWPGETPTAYRIPYDVVIGPMAGDWYDAARCYRQWATRQVWCRKGKLFDRAKAGTIARAMLEAPFVSKPNWVFGDGDDWSKHLTETELWGMKHLDRERDLVGRDVPLVVWWYGWENERFDDDTPLFTARPGVAEAFRQLAAEGATVKPYTQSLLWDIATPAFDERAKAAVCKSRDGSPQISKWYWCEAASMCLSQPVCRDTTIGLADQLAAIGANAIYLDAFPVMRECWDAPHGHPLGYGGNWWARNIRAILAGIKARRGPQFGVMQEYFCEPYLDLADLQMSWWYVEEGDCPVVPAIYSGYAAMSGSHTHKHYPDDVISFRVKQGRCLLWGSQLGRSQLSDYLYDDQKAAFMRQAVRLRMRLNDLLVYGEMLRPPAWLSPPPQVTCAKWNMAHLGTRRFTYDAVEGALWQAPGGEVGLMLANYDDTAHEVSFRVGPWWNGGARRVIMVTSEGESVWQKAVKPGQTVRVELPAASLRALRFRR